MGDAQLGPGKFGSGLVLDGSGDYLSIPRFRGIFDETLVFPLGCFPGNLGLTNNSDDGEILLRFGAERTPFFFGITSVAVEPVTAPTPSMWETRG